MHKSLPVLLLALIISISANYSAAETSVSQDTEQAVMAAPIVHAAASPSAEQASRVKILYAEGIALFDAGKVEESKQKFQDILKIDPTYDSARSKLRVILDTQARELRRDKINANKERELEVEEKWSPPPEKPVFQREIPQAIRIKTKQQKLMEEKAMQVIPEISFTDAHLADVVQYLSRVSGVNIILDEDMFIRQGKDEIAIPVEPENEKGGETAGVSPQIIGMPSAVSDRVTIVLKNIPLIEALKYILSAKGLKYRIDEYAIIVSTPQRLNEVEMETRYYHLVSGIGSFTEYIEPSEKEEGSTTGWEEGGETKKETKLTVKDVLEQSGVPFPTGSKIFLDQRTGTLIIRNTPSNLSIIEDVLRILDVTPYQIEIEARFVQITAGTAQELGLEWIIKSNNLMFGESNNLRLDSKTTDPLFGEYPDPADLTGREGITRGLRYLSDSAGNPVGNILSLSGILTVPEFQMILHALNQSGDANLVSAPKVTTLNNQRAQIQMVEEFIYPGEFEVTPPTVKGLTQSTYTTTGSTTQYTQTIVNTKIVTPGIAVPTSFETRDIGVILNVTPSVGADRKTITLTLIPEISEFIDWIDYGVKQGEGWNAIPIKKPIFQTRSVTTSVVINDGETVVLGGLVKEELTTSEDKIPLLGDIPMFGTLFRSKKEVSTKINLVIFVTARLLTPSGEVMKEAKEYAY